MQVRTCLSPNEKNGSALGREGLRHDYSQSVSKWSPRIIVASECRLQRVAPSPEVGGLAMVQWSRLGAILDNWIRTVSIARMQCFACASHDECRNSLYVEMMRIAIPAGR